MLLEMCRTLFPEYDNIFFGITQSFTHSGYGVILSPQFILFHTKGTQYLTIHWFEFCMTHLSELVLGKQIPRDIQTNYNTFALNCFMYIKKSTKYYIHPVDYLYEQFKKLKDV